MRKKIIAGNWKMFTTISEGIQLTESLMAELTGLGLDGKTIILIPPATHIQSISKAIDGSINVFTGAQNCWHEKEGAFTGEISPRMIKNAGGSYVIIGHSERRQYFKESNELLAKKVNAVFYGSLIPIYCCGETLEERERSDHFKIIRSQVWEGLFHLPPSDLRNVVIAYEPVWAIGTGKTASPDQAQETHHFIREVIIEKYGPEIAKEIPILYGGSVKPGNAKELFSREDIDGGLVGGASLVATDFAAIIKAY